MTVLKSGTLQWFTDHAADFTGQLLFEEPLSKHTYYRIGGPAAIFAIPRTPEDIRWLFDGVLATGIRSHILGAGSNTLASDDGFDGLVIRASRMNLEIAEVAPDLVRTGASVAVSTLLRRAVQEGWSGFEFMTGIPGSIGGAIAMNAGTHLGETKDHVKRVEAYGATRELMTYDGTALKFEYRKNLFLPANAIVWAAEWEIKREDPARVKAVVDETLARRKATQPIDAPSCGSVFKNPKAHGKHAWQVVDQLGLRGHQVGGAQISEKHSNFIVNLGGARASDVRALIDLVKTRARAELGIEMEEEVLYLGI